MYVLSDFCQELSSIFEWHSMIMTPGVPDRLLVVMTLTRLTHTQGVGRGGATLGRVHFDLREADVDTNLFPEHCLIHPSLGEIFPNASPVLYIWTPTQTAATTSQHFRFQPAV